MNKTIDYDVADSVSRIASADCCKHCVTTALPHDPVVTMAYVPFQQWGHTYTSEQALCAGTLFPCLDLPFTMGCCK